MPQRKNSHTSRLAPHCHYCTSRKMYAPPCVFHHCHRTAPPCRLAHRKHLHLFVAKRDPPLHRRSPPHCLESTLLRASHLHNVVSRHHFGRDPHHFTLHRLLRAPTTSRRSGMSRILGYPNFGTSLQPLWIPSFGTLLSPLRNPNFGTLL